MRRKFINKNSVIMMAKHVYFRIYGITQKKRLIVEVNWDMHEGGLFAKIEI
jgi:hypothetical protein